jgi:two-component system, NarL family, response regulator DesR
MKKLRVLVAENHYEVRCSIIVLLSMDFEVVGAVGDGEELIQSAVCLIPDVIVSNIVMPRIDGPTARTQLARQQRTIPFVFLSTLGPEVVDSLTKDLPVAVVHKADMLEHLKNAVASVAAGWPYLSPRYVR